MFIQYSNYNHPILSIEMNENENILILKTSLYSYKYEAVGDCCSASAFKKFKNNDFTFLIGKIIKGIKEINLDDTKYESDTDDDLYVITPHLYQMTFKNSDEIFKFMMVNYSNGFYDGWINSYIII
jgi:hypothetical protein